MGVFLLNPDCHEFAQATAIIPQRKSHDRVGWRLHHCSCGYMNKCAKQETYHDDG